MYLNTARCGSHYIGQDHGFYFYFFFLLQSTPFCLGTLPCSVSPGFPYRASVILLEQGAS